MEIPDQFSVCRACAAFAGQFDARLLAEAESANVLVKISARRARGRFDCSDVARLRKNFRNAEHPEFLVVVNLVADDGDGAVFAIEDFIGARKVLIERRRKRDQF